MTQLIAPQPGIMEISLYQGGASHVAGHENALKLSSNENPFGPSPLALKAYERAGRELHRYPSSDHAELRAAIGEVHGIDPARIICGAGSDEIIAFLCQAYAGPNTEVIHTEHGFAMYRISALAAGATPVEVKEHERVTDVDAILAACTDKTRPQQSDRYDDRARRYCKAGRRAAATSVAGAGRRLCGICGGL